MISEVLDDHLYRGGRYVAQNKELLKQHKITRIVNCAADVCPNYFKDDFIYKTYHLQDSVR